MRQPLATSLFSLLVGANVVSAVCEDRHFTACDDRIPHWYDPSNGQVCDLIYCGGGRFPLKTDVPGCSLYSGTLSPPPVSILSCWKPSGAIQSVASTTAAGESETTSGAATTSADSTSEIQRTTEKPASETSAAESATAPDTPSGSTTTGPITTGPVTTSASTSVKVSITSQSTHAASNGTSNSTSAATLSTHNAGNVIGGSLMAVAGAAIGAIAML